MKYKTKEENSHTGSKKENQNEPTRRQIKEPVEQGFRKKGAGDGLE